MDQPKSRAADLAPAAGRSLWAATLVAEPGSGVDQRLMAPPFEDLRPDQRQALLVDARAFADFFDQGHLPVFRYIYALYGGPQEEVEDLTAETFMRAWNARHRFRGNQQDALRWALRIARNLVFDTQRRVRRQGVAQPIDSAPVVSHDSGPEEALIHQEDVDQLLLALGSLPPRHREMVVLRYVLGWRVKEIAEHLQMNENTVSVNLRRVLARMRHNWPEE